MGANQVNHEQPMTESVEVVEKQDYFCSDKRMERFGPCRFSGCSCSYFEYSDDAQFCDNCGHSRSMHIH